MFENDLFVSVYVCWFLLCLFVCGCVTFFVAICVCVFLCGCEYL